MFTEQSEVTSCWFCFFYHPYQDELKKSNVPCLCGLHEHKLIFYHGFRHEYYIEATLEKKNKIRAVNSET